ncbi:hypothetical protein [Streptomyces sp. ICBB 8177]|uniref:hypothetical protein n=1 Tax=Streptomyces sp. ICBB 8177 TaxID=563922 RepID=UPI000D678491|nr:hypothetical protein [Streptomyces sp. ICBB 8177]PWI45399.1 hypothetical protein CK485_04495 [Streptomyces sp. ICBB 8177]
MVVPSWEAWWRTAATRPVPAMTGTYRVRRPRRDPGNGMTPGRVGVVETFAHRPPGWWRGVRRDPLGAAGDALWITAPAAPDRHGRGFSWDFAGSPRRLAPAGGAGAFAGAVPRGGPRPYTRAGREAAEWLLDVPHAGRLRVVLDAEHPLVLLAETPDGEYREELTDLAFPGSLPEELFDPGHAEAARAAWEVRLRAAQAAWRERPLPAPGHWPGPRPAPRVIDGDLATGLLVLDLGLGGGAPAPGARPVRASAAGRSRGPVAARLARRRRGEPPYLGGIFADPKVFVHTWSDGVWQWSLATEGPALSPEDLSAVIASMPAPDTD